MQVPGLTTAGLSDAVTHMQAGQGVPNLAHGNGRMLAPQDSVNMRNGPTTQAQTNAGMLLLCL